MEHHPDPNHVALKYISETYFWTSLYLLLLYIPLLFIIFLSFHPLLLFPTSVHSPDHRHCAAVLHPSSDICSVHLPNGSSTSPPMHFARDRLIQPFWGSRGFAIRLTEKSISYLIPAQGWRHGGLRGFGVDLFCVLA